MGQRFELFTNSVGSGLWSGTVPDVQRVYFWFSKPALGGLVCGNRVR